MRLAALVAAAALSGCAAGGDESQADRALRVMSLDGCADQYVLAMVPDAELALSPRADDVDSYMAEEAQGRRKVRPSLEAAVGFQPDFVVRQWGGDARLVEALHRRGVRVVEIGDAGDFAEIRANTLRVAEELGRSATGQALAARMDGHLAHGGGNATGEPALYLTAAGWTAGEGTLVDRIMAAAGLRNAAAAPGYAPVGLERLAMDPPRRFVLGFFDRPGSDRRGVGRHSVVQKATARGTTVELPSRLLSCPAWFTAEAVERIAG
jgi:iron complex transport system substrate-binding protein